MSYLALKEEFEKHWTEKGQGGPKQMKGKALLGYVGVFQALIYALLYQFHLTQFTPVMDALLQAASASLGVVGAVALHTSEPPAKQ